VNNWQYYISAYDIDQVKLVTATAIRQKYVDQGISTNVFVPLKKASGLYLHTIYTTAHRLGVKSTYYLRSESADVTECEHCQ